MDQTQITFKASWMKLDSMSHEIIDTLGEEITGNTIMALSLTLARLMSPKALSQADEARFITDNLDWAGAYLAVTKES